jgi:hypothetical protein
LEPVGVGANPTGAANGTLLNEFILLPCHGSVTGASPVCPASMIHHYLDETKMDGKHWGVSHSSDHKNKPTKILVQVNDGIDEARIALSFEQAHEMYEALHEQLVKCAPHLVLAEPPVVTHVSTVDTWAGQVDCMSGAFRQDEIDNAREWR